MNPEISIIIPAYNLENFLENTLLSVRNQRFESWEAIIVDDGSTDHTYSIAKKFADLDERFVVIRQKNMGVSTARNRGIEMAKGRYITFLDGDDLIGPDSLMILWNACTQHKIDVAVGQVKNFSYETPSWQLSDHIEPLFYNTSEAVDSILYGQKINIGCYGFIAKSSLWKNMRFPDGLQYEDLYLMPLFYSQCPKIAYLKYCVYGYRQRQGSAMNQSVVPSRRLEHYRIAIEHIDIFLDDRKNSNAAKARICLESLRLKELLLKSDCNDQQREILLNFTNKRVKKNVFKVLFDVKCPINMRVKIAMLYFFPMAVRILKGMRSIEKS